MYTVAALYKFKKLDNLERRKSDLLSLMRSLDMCGTIILAPEGLNGTVAGSAESMKRFADYVFDVFKLCNDSIKWSSAKDKPFRRLKVKIKDEIVTMRQEGLDPAGRTGQFVPAKDWNAIIDNPDTLVIDTRNTYETELGKFRNAIDPKTSSFSEFAGFVDQYLDPKKHKHVAMYCTGGIRCEKASAYMLEKGFDTVYQLEGGILKYLETVPPEKTRWEGECFVFDYRVAVDHSLKEGTAKMCFGCGDPVTHEDQSSPLYVEGISCPRCAHMVDTEREHALRQKHRHYSDIKS